MKYLTVRVSAALMAILGASGCMKSPVVDFQPSAPRMGMAADEARFAPLSPAPRFFWTQDIDVKVRSKDLTSYEHVGDLTVEHEVQLDEADLSALAHKHQADLVIAELVFAGMGDGVGKSVSSERVRKESSSATNNEVKNWVGYTDVPGADGFECKQQYSLRKEISHVYRLKLYRRLKD